MKTRVVNVYREPHDVLVGRPSKWGNPFSHKKNTLAKFRVRTKKEAVDMHREWIKTQPDLMNALHELKGKVIACYCDTPPCHANTLAELADNFGEVDTDDN